LVREADRGHRRCGCRPGGGVTASTGERRPSAVPPGIHKIEHVVTIIQENRSFDHYFGTYPGADGIPPGVCVPDPRGGCVRPFHSRRSQLRRPHA
jgi:phospholipase C